MLISFENERCNGRSNVQNPPSTPHMGGACKRIIRTVQEVLFATANNTILSNSQMLTVSSEVDISTYLSKDYKDLESVTLSHHLIGRNFYNDFLDDIYYRDIVSRKN